MRPSFALSMVVAALGLTALAAPAAARGSASIGVVPLAIAIADENGTPVRDSAWVDAQIAEAEKLFGPIGVHFKKASTKALDPKLAHLENKKDRDALLATCDKNVINVNVVASLRDVDDPKRMRMGVHWRPGSAPKKHYVIVSASAMPTTLAHELGHYFGLAHSPVTDNLMSYSRGEGTIFLDPTQAKTILQFARNSIAAKEFTPDPLP